MKRYGNILLTVFLLTATFSASAVCQAADSDNGGYGYGMGPGMMGGNGYGMGAGMMGNQYGYEPDIPSKLPAPKTKQWADKLKDALALEEKSLAQYVADQEKFNVYMPYMMVIPQEENHISMIERLFAAYGTPMSLKAPAASPSKDIEAAYALGEKMEAELLPLYEWLIKNTGDSKSADALNYILLQSRWHWVMFDHAERMGHGHGYSMGGYGMGGMMGYGMGAGMMGGNGYGMGYGQRYRNGSEGPVSMSQAKAMINYYLASSRNPNLKAGKIKDTGSAYEADILTKNNSLVDKIVIDKNTGRMRSVY